MNLQEILAEQSVIETDMPDTRRGRAKDHTYDSFFGALVLSVTEKPLWYTLDSFNNILATYGRAMAVKIRPFKTFSQLVSKLRAVAGLAVSVRNAGSEDEQKRYVSISRAAEA